MHGMHGSMSKWITGVVAAMALAGCGNEQCDKFGEHLADVAMKEAKQAGQPVADDKRADIVKKTVEACNAEPPTKEALECALAAASTKAMKKCEGVDEDAKKE
jgi:hypothetical protein